MKVLVFAAVLASARAAHAAAQDVQLDERTHALVLELARDPVPPADPTNRVADDPRAAALGQFLFFDARLSADGTFSCASCHEPARAFTDGRAVARGHADLARNTPTLLDVARRRWLFWDGRADSAWSQALGPLENADEMRASRMGVARLVATDSALRGAYTAIFGAPPDVSDAARFPPEATFTGAAESAGRRAWLAMTPEDRDAVDTVFANVGKSLAAYERQLLPSRSPFDEYARDLRVQRPPEELRYPAAARRGLALFLGKANCRSCHVGPNFTDEEFHNIGVPPRDESSARDSGRHGGIAALLADPFNARGTCSDARDCERARELEQLTQTPETYAAWRTPSLRNVARTAPYMHQGQFATLRDVVEYYSTLKGSVPIGHHGEKVLKPLNLTEDEKNDLVAFLESLTDVELPAELLRAPASPFRSQPITPKGSVCDAGRIVQVELLTSPTSKLELRTFVPEPARGSRTELRRTAKPDSSPTGGELSVIDATSPRGLLVAATTYLGGTTAVKLLFAPGERAASRATGQLLVERRIERLRVDGVELPSPGDAQLVDWNGATHVFCTAHGGGSADDWEPDAYHFVLAPDFFVTPPPSRDLTVDAQRLGDAICVRAAVVEDELFAVFRALEGMPGNPYARLAPLVVVRSRDGVTWTRDEELSSSIAVGHEFAFAFDGARQHLVTIEEHWGSAGDRRRIAWYAAELDGGWGAPRELAGLAADDVRKHSPIWISSCGGEAARFFFLGADGELTSRPLAPR